MSLCCWIAAWQKLCFCSKVGVVIGTIALLLLIWFTFLRKKLAINVRDFKKDVVYLFQIPSTRTIVSLSPFCLKLETWLRLKQIPYESIRGVSKWSKYGMIPFVELNGEQIADSNIIIQHVEKKFDKQDDLSADQRGVSRAFTIMLENQTLWSYIYYRYVEVPQQFLKQWPFLTSVQRFFASRYFTFMIKNRVHHHGIGRHAVQEIYQFGMQDIQALSDYLGSKSFMMGDKITTVDCAVFAHLSQLLHIPIEYPHKDYLEKNCPNLVAYVDRIKAEIWPDWDDVCARHMHG